ncbi:2-amino-4-hydroxy-6-hydroxymethyldihydropteridine diphosphokinase [Porphyromonas crevioricanis]|uniref:2-amino-4-hydroxy-6-hydroxymethyldihydropteridine pyrophosphokinase n=1 Tax=Porphyromonas crevioricanis JCM 15906 TaxID=1305617 RepID=T1DTJ3_9PORP|nr:2-amino-4-hydroxy-6-hydroxymethyldihydropteridine diphosphokinase [Porphyromonas crevioricanis]GAD06220.1 hypothetical protein PORCRE_1944 [Porphyromonas crevioricanis JCM 15906]
MMNSNRILISLGSNYYAIRRIKKARKLLSKHFPRICFSPPILNPAVDCEVKCHDFINCLGIIHTDLGKEDCRQILKQVEQSCGRLKYPKTESRISIDIDLLIWNTEVCKPADMERPYIQIGMQQLNISTDH